MITVFATFFISPCSPHIYRVTRASRFCFENIRCVDIGHISVVTSHLEDTWAEDTDSFTGSKMTTLKLYSLVGYIGTLTIWWDVNWVWTLGMRRVRYFRTRTNLWRLQISCDVEHPRCAVTITNGLWQLILFSSFFFYKKVKNSVWNISRIYDSVLRGHTNPYFYLKTTRLN